MKKIALIGCGNIGFRHLQALLESRLKGELDLTIIEPNGGHHDRIQAELASSFDGPSVILTEQPKSAQQYDLAIVATNADVRFSVFNAFADQHTFGSIIFEKVLFQSVAQIDATESRLENVTSHVNCGRRGFPGYSMLRQELGDLGVVNYSVNGTEYGLASNVIHFLDIAAFVNQSTLISIDVSGLDSESGRSKRDQYIEVYGTIVGTLANGAKVRISCAKGEQMSFDIAIDGEGFEAVIDEFASQVQLQRDGERKQMDFETLRVSGMPFLYDALLEGNPCLLPTYAESAQQHRLLLTALNEHLGLPNSPETICPIS